MSVTQRSSRRMHLLASFMVSTAFFCASSVAKTTRPDEVQQIEEQRTQFVVGPIIFDSAPWEQWIHENLCLVDVLAKDVEYHLENEQRTISTLAQS